MINFKDLHERTIPNIEAIFNSLNIATRLTGKELQFINPLRDDTDFGSASINVETGMWADFAEGGDPKAKGGDLISLVAYLTDTSQSLAAEKLQSFLCEPAHHAAVESVNTQTHMVIDGVHYDLVYPVPDGAPFLPRDFGDGLGEPSEMYPYKNEQGTLLGYILRFDLFTGKTIRPATLWMDDTGKYRWKLNGFPKPRPLYNLHLLAQKTDAPVLIVEGEKSANAASQLFLDHVVVTTMHGAKSPDKSDLTQLKGRDVFIWPDNDEPGQAYAETMAKLLRSQDEKARVNIMLPITDSATYTSDTQEPMLVPGFIPSEGWDAADALAEGWTPDHIELLPDSIWSTVPITIKNKVFWAGDFYVNNFGVFQKKKNDDGEEYSIQIASRILPVAVTRNGHGKNWGLLLEVENPVGNINEWAMPQELLSGSGEACREQLLNLGAKIFNKEGLSQFLMLSRPKRLALCTELTGWHGNIFIMPQKTFGHSDERVVIQNSSVGRQSDFGTSGTLDDWKSNVAAKCEGNSRLIFAVCISLTGPFLQHLAEENGGFHLRGASSSGKTKTLSVAASVWGSKPMVKAWRSTGNAIESLAIEHNDCVLILDELGQVSSNDAGDIAYTLGNGQQKARSNRSGNVRPITRWRLLFISTGEIGLAEHVATAGVRIKAGQEIRMLDIPSDAGAGLGVFENIHGAPSPQQFADSLQECSEHFYGTAAETLLTRLTSSTDELALATNFIKQLQKDFVGRFVPADSHGQLFRAAAKFGMVAGVGEYCIEIGILPWEKGDAFNAAQKCYLSWLDARGGGNASEEIRALNQVKGYFEQHGESRFTLINPHVEDNVGQRTINRAGFRTVANNGSVEYWVMPEAYKTQICAGFDPKLVTRVLIENNYLQLDSAGKAQITKRLPGSEAASRVYVFNSSIIESNNTGGDEQATA